MMNVPLDSGMELIQAIYKLTWYLMASINTIVINDSIRKTKLEVFDAIRILPSRFNTLKINIDTRVLVYVSPREHTIMITSTIDNI